jgi:4-hydroxy-2,2'-bipyrrole-5-carbaldehyde O-methyltransferase
MSSSKRGAGIISVLPHQVRTRIAARVGGAATLARMATSPQLPLLLVLSRRFAMPVYRASFLAAASGSGVLRWLAVRPCDLESIALKLGVSDRRRLRTWLDSGVRLGDLGKRDGCYRLRSRAAKALAARRNDATAAALEEVLRYHVPALLDGPAMYRDQRRFQLTDQDGTVIARSTQVVRPLVEQAISAVLDRDSAVRLLELGCGSGVYVRHAARLNPHLTAVAVDMQADVVVQAEKNIAEWGLTDRVEVRHGDLLRLAAQPQFDLVTLHNNIYYFADDARVDALRQARSLLAPGGRLLLTTACRGGHVGLDMLNLWLENADFGGGLPRERDLLDQLREAGFADVRCWRVVPGEQFRAFVGTNL